MATSMLLLWTIKKQVIIPKSTAAVHTWVKFIRWQDVIKEHEYRLDRDERQKTFKLKGGMYISPEKPQDVEPSKPIEMQTKTERGAMMSFDFIAAHTQMRYLDFSPDAINRYRRYSEFVERQYDQRFIAERHLYLGSDLATAHFLVHRDGKIKFLTDDTWYAKDAKGNYTLPGRRVKNLFVEAIDASNTLLMFEGFENMTNLKNLRMLNLTKCRYVNDWCMSKMNQFEHSLEFLDLSHCDRISAKGLSALACLKKLKYLRLEGMSHVKDIAKVALMLEESIPNLEVLGLDYDTALDRLEQELKLMEHSSVIEDAKGNLHIQDNAGQWFYVGGKLDEKPVVDDDDLPMVKSLIRPDPPELPLEELDEINALSGGKLKHMLVGSPSGLSWTAETERILSFESKKLLKTQAQLHPFMLPKETRQQLLEADDKSVLLDYSGDRSHKKIAS